MLEIVKTVGIFIFLVCCSLQDIKEKQLSVKMLVLAGISFAALYLLCGQASFEEWRRNMLPGMFAFFLAFLTKEQIGYGDAACLAVLGSVVSCDALLGAIISGLLLLSIYSIALLIGKKADRKTKLPFLPFLTAGMLWQMII